MKLLIILLTLILVFTLGMLAIPADMAKSYVVTAPIRLDTDYTEFSDASITKASQVTSTVSNTGIDRLTLENIEGFEAGQFLFLKESDSIFEVAEVVGIEDNTVIFVRELDNVYHAGAYVTTYYPAIYVTGKNVTIRNVKIDGNNSNQEDTRGLFNGPDDDWGEIYLLKSDSARIIDTEITNSQFNAVTVVSSIDVFVERGQYRHNWSNGINFHQANYGCKAIGVLAEYNDDDGFEADNGSTYTIFANNIARNNGDRNFKADFGRAVFVGNQSYGGALGIEAFGEGHTITGNFIENPNDFGIYLHNASAVSVTGNTIVNAPTGIYATGENSNIELAGNVFQDVNNDIYGIAEETEEGEVDFLPAQAGYTNGTATMGGYGPVHELKEDRYSSFYINSREVVSEIEIIYVSVGDGSFDWIFQAQISELGQDFMNEVVSFSGTDDVKNRIENSVIVPIGRSGSIGGKFWCEDLDGPSAVRVIGYNIERGG